MNSIEQLEAEVMQEASLHGIDLLIRLIDKLELDNPITSLEKRLHTYVALKIYQHHYTKKYFSGWHAITEESFTIKNNFLKEKIKEARRNYYVAKQSS